MNTNIRNSPTRGSRRNAAVSYDISRHLPINQLPPMQSYQHVNPRDVVLPSMPKFMRMMFRNDTLFNTLQTVLFNSTCYRPSAWCSSSWTLHSQSVQGSTQHFVPPHPRNHVSTHYSLSNTRPIPVYLRVKGMVSSDELGKRRVHPPSPRPLHKPRP